jgi:hypothetical protein
MAENFTFSRYAKPANRTERGFNRGDMRKTRAE